MSFFDEQPRIGDAIVAPQDAAPAPRLGFLDGLTTSYHATTEVTNQLALDNGFRDAEQAQIQSIRAAGGTPHKSLNDVEDDSTGEAPYVSQMAGDTGTSRPYRSAAQFFSSGGADDPQMAQVIGQRNAEIEALQKQYPQLGLKTYDQLWAGVQQNARDVSNKLATSPTTIGGSLGEFLGGAVGSMSPRSAPLNFATLGLPIAEGAGLAARIGIQAGAAGASDAATQLEGGNTDQSLLLGTKDQGFSFGQVAEAAGGGALGELGFHVAGHAIGAAARQIGKLFPDADVPVPPRLEPQPPDPGTMASQPGVDFRQPDNLPRVSPLDDFETFRQGLNDYTAQTYGSTRLAEALGQLDAAKVHYDLDAWDGPAPWEVAPRTDAAVLPDVTHVDFGQPLTRFLENEGQEAIARRIDPETFRQMDALSDQMEQSRQRLQDLSMQREQDADAHVADLQKQVDAAQERADAATGKRRNPAQQKLADLIRQRDEARAGFMDASTRTAADVQKFGGGSLEDRTTAAARTKDPGERVVRVDVKKVDDAWKSDTPDFHVPPQERGASFKLDRAKDFINGLKPGDAFDAPKLGVSQDNFGFDDGRHRFAAMRDLGFSTAPVAMDARSIENARARGWLVEPTPLRGALTLGDETDHIRAADGGAVDVGHPHELGAFLDHARGQLTAADDPMLKLSTTAMRGLFEHLKEAARTPVYTVSREDAEKILPNNKAAGWYDPNHHYIIIKKSEFTTPANVAWLTAHEGLHAQYYWAIEHDPQARSVINYMSHVAQEFAYNNNLVEHQNHYGFKNAHEFISEAFSGKTDFQRYLSTVPAPADLTRLLDLVSVKRSPVATLWDAFLEGTRRILGLPKGQESILESVIRYGDALSSSRNERAGAAGHPAGQLSAPSSDVRHADGGRLFRPDAVPQGVTWDMPNGIRYELKGRKAHILSSVLPEDMQGKGFGTGMYRDFVDAQLAKGRTVVSDNRVSAEAAKVYDRLKAEGYDVTRLDSAKTTDSGVVYTPEARPPFEIKGRPEAGPLSAPETAHVPYLAPRDSVEMAAERANLMKIDEQQRDLAPLVSRAFAAAEGEWKAGRYNPDVIRFLRDLETHPRMRWKADAEQLQPAMPDPAWRQQEVKPGDALTPLTPPTLADKVPEMTSRPDVTEKIAQEPAAKQVSAVLQANAKDLEPEIEKFQQTIGKLLADGAEDNTIRINGTDLHLDKDRITVPTSDGEGTKDVSIRTYLQDLQQDHEALQAISSCRTSS